MPKLQPGAIKHTTLNQKLWNDYALRPEVRKGLLKIAKEFYKFLQVPVDVVDVIITGSQCSYTYTQYSDLDLHIIVDYKTVACDQPVEELFDTKRNLWKLRHNIEIHSIPVEAYVEDTAKPVNGSTYSILHNHWIKKPEHRDFSDHGVERVAKAWQTLILQAIKDQDIDELQRLKELLKQYRQAGLDRNGELGRANLVYKTLRNSGLIASLMQHTLSAQDQDLSVPEDLT